MKDLLETQAEYGFRHILRNSSQSSHDDTETVFARFFSAPETHLVWFLAAQRAGLWAVYQSSANQGELLSRTILGDLIERLDFDLAEAGARATAINPAASLDPMAADYLILGSRLGTETMRRQYFSSAAPERTPTYFMAPAIGPLWRRHCTLLEEIDPASSRAARIIADTKIGFDLFKTAAQAQVIHRG